MNRVQAQDKILGQLGGKDKKRKAKAKNSQATFEKEIKDLVYDLKD